MDDKATSQMMCGNANLHRDSPSALDEFQTKLGQELRAVPWRRIMRAPKGLSLFLPSEVNHFVIDRDKLLTSGLFTLRRAAVLGNNSADGLDLLHSLLPEVPDSWGTQKFKLLRSNNSFLTDMIFLLYLGVASVIF